MLIIGSEKEVERVHNLCINKFRWVMIETGKNHPYLGMQLDFSCGTMLTCTAISTKFAGELED
jgi:hypothetical protein